MLCVFWFVWSLKSNVATDARSVWVKVEYRRPFSGVPSVTTLSFRRPPSATTFNFFRTTLSCDPSKAERSHQWSHQKKVGSTYPGMALRASAALVEFCELLSQ